MSEYTIKKPEQKVQVQMKGQPMLYGCLFLGAVSSRHGQQERVLEVLEQPEPFMPFMQANGEVILLHRPQIQHVLVDADYELAILNSYGPGAYEIRAVELWYRGGKKEQGELLIEMIEGASRAMDQLNRSQVFLMLKLGDKVKLIGLQHIAAVQEL